jgi:Tfp pilus assembly protein PilF
MFFGEQFLGSFKEPDKAIRYFEMAADAYPQSWSVWDRLGEAHAANGDKQQARTMYEKSLALNPQNENARKKLSSLRAQ